MNSRRAKLVAGATVLGLGALGGAAIGSNPGMPAVRPAATGAGARIVTSASGSAAAVSQPVALRTNPGARPPIVTRASGTGPIPGAETND